jgi:predicted dehydrogenase
MKRIAIIGCGRISPAHLNGLKTLTGKSIEIKVEK